MKDNLDFGTLYDNYGYSPSSVGVGDHLSDLFLGTNKVQQKNQNNLNFQLMKEQNRFNEYMSNTSYQRAVRDMKAAGINPMVVANVGGASSPASAQLSAQAPDTTAKAVNKNMKELSHVLLAIAKIVGV